MTILYPTSTNPPTVFVTITPNDTTVLGGYQWLRCGSAGNLVLKSDLNAATACTIVVTAGEYVPFGGGIVMTTGHSAGTVHAFG